MKILLKVILTILLIHYSLSVTCGNNQCVALNGNCVDLKFGEYTVEQTTTLANAHNASQPCQTGDINSSGCKYNQCKDGSTEGVCHKMRFNTHTATTRDGSATCVDNSSTKCASDNSQCASYDIDGLCNPLSYGKYTYNDGDSATDGNHVCQRGDHATNGCLVDQCIYDTTNTGRCTVMAYENNKTAPKYDGSAQCILVNVVASGSCTNTHCKDVTARAGWCHALTWTNPPRVVNPSADDSTLGSTCLVGPFFVTDASTSKCPFGYCIGGTEGYCYEMSYTNPQKVSDKIDGSGTCLTSSLTSGDGCAAGYCKDTLSGVSGHCQPLAFGKYTIVLADPTTTVTGAESCQVALLLNVGTAKGCAKGQCKKDNTTASEGICITMEFGTLNTSATKNDGSEFCQSAGTPCPVGYCKSVDPNMVGVCKSISWGGFVVTTNDGNQNCLDLYIPNNGCPANYCKDSGGVNGLCVVMANETATSTVLDGSQSCTPAPSGKNCPVGYCLYNSVAGWCRQIGWGNDQHVVIKTATNTDLDGSETCETGIRVQGQCPHEHCKDQYTNATNMPAGYEEGRCVVMAYSTYTSDKTDGSGKCHKTDQTEFGTLSNACPAKFCKKYDITNSRNYTYGAGWCVEAQFGKNVVVSTTNLAGYIDGSQDCLQLRQIGQGCPKVLAKVQNKVNVLQ